MLAQPIAIMAKYYPLTTTNKKGLTMDEFNFEQLTQDDIDTAKANGFEDYLGGSSIGDWVYDDNEMLCSYDCVYQWYSTTPQGTERYDELREILNQLEQLNKKD